MIRIALLIALLLLSISAQAQNVTVKATDQPAPAVFRSIMEQTGKNFVYPSELLRDMRISINAKDRPLKEVLNTIFKDSGIKFKIKGKNVVLKRGGKRRSSSIPERQQQRNLPTLPASTERATMLRELIVRPEGDVPVIETTDIGAKRLSGEMINRLPTLFGERDIIRALKLLPGVSEANEGMAEMNVHGGNRDENLFLLDGTHIYEANHLAGLFSSFNTDIIKEASFHKNTIPARYDGRLSSVADIRLTDGFHEGHHGTARIGLTSGAFNISGPIGERTNYVLALRRSWLDLLTIPMIALINSRNPDETNKLHYAFTDFNAKITHRFTDRLRGFAGFYLSDERLRGGWEDKHVPSDGYWSDELAHLNVGNIMAHTGFSYTFNPSLSAEGALEYTRYAGSTKYDYLNREYEESKIISTSKEFVENRNNVNDVGVRSNFTWTPTDNTTVRFGGSYTRHFFLPDKEVRASQETQGSIAMLDTTSSIGANEARIFIENDWKISGRLRINAGLNGSIFHVDGKTKGGLSPRFSLRFSPANGFALKTGYTRTVQYVHQINQTYLSLPSDKWVPVTGEFKPKTTDKIALGAYWQNPSGEYAVSVEGYWKWMRNILDYRDEYYLIPPSGIWSDRLCTGKGDAKGIDIMLEKKGGKFTGQIGYSLAWADRQFKEKNGGMKFPARFDHRHTVKIVANWDVSRKVTLSAFWTGHSGNRFTFMPQMFEAPEFASSEYFYDDAPLRVKVNNFKLPFYHRLDLSCMVRNKRGFWTFSLYNAYCNMNPIAVIRGESIDYIVSDPFDPSGTSSSVNTTRTFKYIKLLPIIPSLSYTWIF